MEIGYKILKKCAGIDPNVGGISISGNRNIPEPEIGIYLYLKGQLVKPFPGFGPIMVFDSPEPLLAYRKYMNDKSDTVVFRVRYDIDPLLEQWNGRVAAYMEDFWGFFSRPRSVAVIRAPAGTLLCSQIILEDRIFHWK